MPSLVLPRAGVLRDGVSVTEDGDSVRIAYSLWQVSVPRAWVEARPAVAEVLQGKRSRRAVSADAEAEGLFTLLDAQGCFHQQESKADYSLQDVRALFDPFRSSWYAAYYAHPFWQRLRTGEASRNELLAWVIHNYHISRAAGVVGARMASHVSDPAWRTFFRHDALDEYWHCDAYYFVRHPSLTLGIRDVQEYVPLPGSLGFELHTLQTAERDPLGHLLVAYFQESSIIFYEDSKAFYRGVDRAYELPGFFTSWEQHIRIDQEHGHADGLARLFVSDRRVLAQELHTALRNAWLAYWFLCRSLDDARAEALSEDAIRLRSPVRGGVIDSATFREIHPVALPAPIAAGGGSVLEILEHWALGLGDHVEARALTVTAQDVTFLLRGTLRAAFAALGHAREHDELMAVGRLAEGLTRFPGVGDSPVPDEEAFDSPWCVVLVAFLAEVAVRPQDFLAHVWALASYCRALHEGGSGNLPAVAALADQFLAGLLRQRRVDVGAADGLLTSLVQFEEVIARWLFLPDRFAPEDIAL